MKAALCAVFLGAFCSLSCFDSGDDPGRNYRGGGGYVARDGCERFTSCATCTPVLGCGWCQAGDKGVCLSDPDECSLQTSFSWTWERAFCPAESGAADAGVDGANDAQPADGHATSEAGASTDGSAEHAVD